MQNISPTTHSIDDLAELVFEYLITKYQPHKERFGDLGYHVAGFDKEQRPRLYHCFWGTDRPLIHCIKLKGIKNTIILLNRLRLPCFYIMDEMIWQRSQYTLCFGK
jgi:hypothetical protein